jgi:signal transduction histidine kinase
MAERLRQRGGELKIETIPGAGFALRAWMPQ